jgi:adenine-specific DNA-methyltransferase
VLGFLVPATVLADSTGEPIRKLLLDTSRIGRCIVIPERARAFAGVTQSLAILITRKGKPTESVSPECWSGTGTIPHEGGQPISRALIDRLGLRVPIVKTRTERLLLEELSDRPPLKTIARVHQGEINLTVDRRYLTDQPTGHPLIRGEHVEPFQVRHPSARVGRLDWVLPEYPGIVAHDAIEARSPEPATAAKRTAFARHARIVLGRVVNMETAKRLKAAIAQQGWFLGDMTNGIPGPRPDTILLLGLLNSSLLNWRFKVTSTNNYVSAAEVEALPLPAILSQSCHPIPGVSRTDLIRPMLDDPPLSISASLAMLKKSSNSATVPLTSEHLISMTEAVVREIMTNPASPASHGTRKLHDLQPILDGLVVTLYGVEKFSDVLEVPPQP